MADHPSPQEARAARRHFPETGPAGEDRQGIGDDALRLGRWFARSKYRLMGEFLSELQRAPEERDPQTLRAKYCHVLAHARRVQTAKSIVTVLLALGAGAAAWSAVLNIVAVGDVVARVAAIAASLSVVLLLVRLALDRYLERVDVTATFLAIGLATAAREAPPGARLS